MSTASSRELAGEEISACQGFYLWFQKDGYNCPVEIILEGIFCVEFSLSV